VNSTCGNSNGSIDLTVSGGTPAYTYNWGGGVTTQDRSNLAAGTYTVTVTDANNCTKTISATVNNTGGPSVTETHVNVLCYGASTGSIDISVSGGTAPYTYNWGGGITTQDRSNLAAGNYCVTVSDANACTAVLCVNITQPADLVPSETHVNVLCNGANTGSIDVSVTGGVSPYTYNWGGGITTQDRSNLAAGTYTVTVTDANNCTKTLSATITQPSALTVTETNVDVLCNGASTGSIDVSVSGGTSPYTYNWGGGVTTQDRTGLAAGTYTVTVTDANNCTKTLSATITEPSALSVTETHVNVLCNGASTGSIDVSVSGGTSPYTYNWGGGITTQDRTGLAAGTYTVTVTDANNCTKTLSATISQPPALVVTETNVDVLCFGNSTGSIDVSVSGGTSPYTYNWGGGITTQDRTGLAAGTYTVTVTDANNCTAKTVSATITQPPALVVTETNVDVLCFGNSTGSIDVSVSGGTAPYTYNWGGGITTQDRSNLAAGTYTVTVTDANNCTKDPFRNNYGTSQWPVPFCNRDQFYLWKFKWCNQLDCYGWHCSIHLQLGWRCYH
jgi:aminopeptidase-like protein